MHWLLLILPLVLINVNLLAAEPIPIEIEITNKQHGEKIKQIGAESSPLFIIGEVRTKKSEEETREEAKQNKAKAENDTALVNYTLWLVIVTFFLSCFTALLWWVTYKLSKNARDTNERQTGEMKESLETAKKAAQAAINGNELNREIFASSQRPWVIVQKIIPIGLLNLNENGLSFKMIVKNVGHSPAMNDNVNVSAIMHLPHRGNAHEILEMNVLKTVKRLFQNKLALAI